MASLSAKPSTTPTPNSCACTGASPSSRNPTKTPSPNSRHCSRTAWPPKPKLPTYSTPNCSPTHPTHPLRKNPPIPKLASFLNPLQWGRRPRLRRTPWSGPPTLLNRLLPRNPILKLASFLNPLVGLPILAATAFQSTLVTLACRVTGDPEPLPFPRPQPIQPPPHFRIGTDPQSCFALCAKAPHRLACASARFDRRRQAAANELESSRWKKK